MRQPRAAGTWPHMQSSTAVNDAGGPKNASAGDVEGADEGQVPGGWRWIGWRMVRFQRSCGTLTIVRTDRPLLKWGFERKCCVMEENETHQTTMISFVCVMRRHRHFAAHYPGITPFRSPMTLTDQRSVMSSVSEPRKIETLHTECDLPWNRTQNC